MERHLESLRHTPGKALSFMLCVIWSTSTSKRIWKNPPYRLYKKSRGTIKSELKEISWTSLRNLSTEQLTNESKTDPFHSKWPYRFSTKPCILTTVLRQKSTRTLSKCKPARSGVTKRHNDKKFPTQARPSQKLREMRGFIPQDTLF